MLLVLCGERPVRNRYYVLLRGSNEAAIQWPRRCRNGEEFRSGGLMPFSGTMEMIGGWHFHVMHLSGIFNDVAYGISR